MFYNSVNIFRNYLHTNCSEKFQDNSRKLFVLDLVFVKTIKLKNSLKPGGLSTKIPDI